MTLMEWANDIIINKVPVLRTEHHTYKIYRNRTDDKLVYTTLKDGSTKVKIAQFS